MFIERFIRYLQFEKRFSPHTVSAYQKDIQQFSEYLSINELEFKDVKHQHVRSWMVELLEQDREPRTIHRKLSALRSYYKFLVRENMVEFNPMLQVKPPKIPKRLPVIIDETKLNGLLDSNEVVFADNFAGLQEKLIIELLFGTGMRLAELISLKESDINMYEQNVKVLGKRSKERIIPVNISLMNLVKQYLDEKKHQKFNNNSSALIVTKEGKSAYPKFIYRIVKKYISLISTHDKRSPHVLRHTFATSLLNHGADINAIKELLGHASLAATQVYTHNSVERLKSIYKQAHPKA
jgi:integrase/recombinase XerC